MRNSIESIAPRMSVAPMAISTAENGTSIDRLGFESCIVGVGVGATSGSPTSFTVDAKVQDSADGSTGWADITGAAMTQIVSTNSVGKIALDLRGAKRYIRVVVTPGFTGGTSPDVLVSAVASLAEPQEKPVA